MPAFSMRVLWAALALWAGPIGQALALQAVEFASLDSNQGRSVQLKAFWLPADGAAGRRPAVALLHGCGGAYARSGGLSARMREYAALLNQRGMHVLVVDSRTPRGFDELCTTDVGARAVTQAHRRLDALASIDWLARHADVDAQRIGLLGWSNGGSTVLAATNLRHPRVAAHPHKPAFSIAFYPGCEAELKRGYEASSQLLLLVGEADDWTPAAPCHQLVQSSTGILRPMLQSYAGAHHGFDSKAPVRLRRDVPGGANPGQGVHVGGDAEARRQSRERLLRFLDQMR